jgi:hypothetical protein
MVRFEVRPIEKKRWHGKKGEESFTLPKTIEVLYDVGQGRYATGLTDEEAVEYGKRLGLDLSPIGTPHEPHPTWSQKSMWISLPNHTVILDLEKPMDFIKSKNLRASKFVANSLKEYEDGLYPEASHVIYDEEEDMAIKAIKTERKQEAIGFISKLSRDDKAAIILIMTDKMSRKKSDNYLNVEIDRLAEENTEDFLRWVKLGRADLTTRARVIEMHYMSILTKEGEAFYYMSELLGKNLDETVAWFKNPDNQALKVKILEKIS